MCKRSLLSRCPTYNAWETAKIMVDKAVLKRNYVLYRRSYKKKINRMLHVTHISKQERVSFTPYITNASITYSTTQWHQTKDMPFEMAVIKGILTISVTELKCVIF